MADLAHVIGEDLELGPTGDLAVVVDDTETKQRILHRLLTSAGTYIWQPSYGAGLPGLIGSVISQQQIAAIIRAQMKYEPSVMALPEPSVSLTHDLLGGITATITYSDRVSTTAQTLNLAMGG